MPFCFYMATIILKHPILLEGDQGKQLSIIECRFWQKGLLIDSVEVTMDEKRITIPIHNVTAIIE